MNYYRLGLKILSILLVWVHLIVCTAEGAELLSANNKSMDTLSPVSLIADENIWIMTTFSSCLKFVLSSRAKKQDTAQIDIAKLNLPARENAQIARISLENDLFTVVFNIVHVSGNQKTAKQVSYSLNTKDIDDKQSMGMLFAAGKVKQSEISGTMISNESLIKKITVSDDQIIERVNPLKSFLLWIKGNLVKIILVGLFLIVFVQPLSGQDISSRGNTQAPIVSTVIGVERRQIEDQFSDIIYDLSVDIIRREIIKKEAVSVNSPGFNDYLQQRLDNVSKEATDLTMAGLNWDMHQTIYRSLILSDGTRTTFYDEVHRIADAYQVDPYLLFMHAVLERSDLRKGEETTDRLKPGASRGSFQMQESSLLSYIRQVYDLPVSQRQSQFPFTRKYQTLAQFQNEVDLSRVLELENEANYYSLEIELAATFLKMQYRAMVKLFPNYFGEVGFNIENALPDASRESKNLLNLWTLFYTSNPYIVQGKSMDEIFSYWAERDHGIYTWMRSSWGVLQTIKQIDALAGYAGFAESQFEHIDKNETGREREIPFMFAEAMHEYGGWIILGLFFFVAITIGAAVEYFKNKATKKEVFNSFKKGIDTFGVSKKFKSFQAAPFETQRIEQKRPITTKVPAQNISSRTQNVTALKSHENKIGVHYPQVFAETFKLLEPVKGESLYDFLLRLSDEVMEEVIKSKKLSAQFINQDKGDVFAEDVLKNVSLRIYNSDKIKLDKLDKEVKAFLQKAAWTNVLDLLDFLEKNISPAETKQASTLSFTNIQIIQSAA